MLVGAPLQMKPSSAPTMASAKTFRTMRIKGQSMDGYVQHVQLTCEIATNVWEGVHGICSKEEAVVQPPPQHARGLSGTPPAGEGYSTQRQYNWVGNNYCARTRPHTRRDIEIAPRIRASPPRRSIQLELFERKLHERVTIPLQSSMFLLRVVCIQVPNLKTTTISEFSVRS